MDTGLLEGMSAEPPPPADGGGVPGYSAASFAIAQELEVRGAELAGLLAAATAGLVQVLAEAITTEAWRGAGIRSVEHWATLRFGLSTSRAHRLTAAAVKLADLPSCRAAFAAGEITEDHIAAVVGAGIASIHDDQAADLARVATVGQLRRALSFLPPPPDPMPATEPQPEPEPEPKRADPAPTRREWLSTGYDEHGSWTIHGQLDADRGALIERALLAARDQLFRARHTNQEPTPADLADITGVDALEHLAHTALDTLDPGTTNGGRRPAERFVIDLHLTATNPYHGRLHLGPALPAWLSGLTSCDAEVRTWVHTLDGNVNLGRRQRTVDPKLRKVIEHRDGGCRIPGCDATRWLRIHHLHHWADGGPTDTPNLVALCSAHHRLVHQGELLFTGNADGDLSITTPDGRPFGPTPPRPPNQPLPDAADDAGLPHPGWTNRSGERAQWRWFTWNEPTTTSPDEPPG